MADTNCLNCGSPLGPRPAVGCVAMVICLVIGAGLVMLALKIMDGLTYGGIWK